jgi:hypothetical protein
MEFPRIMLNYDNLRIKSQKSAKCHTKYFYNPISII